MTLPQLCASALFATLTCVLPPAQAQSFPAKPVRVVTPFPAGSGPEVALRWWPTA